MSYINTSKKISTGLFVENNNILLCYDKETDLYYLPKASVSFGESIKNALNNHFFNDLELNKVIDNICIDNLTGIIENKSVNNNQINFFFEIKGNLNKSYDSIETRFSFKLININDLDKYNIKPKADLEYLKPWAYAKNKLSITY